MTEKKRGMLYFCGLQTPLLEIRAKTGKTIGLVLIIINIVFAVIAIVALVALFGLAASM